MGGEYSVLSVGGVVRKKTERGKSRLRVLNAGPDPDGNGQLDSDKASLIRRDLIEYYSNGKDERVDGHVLNITGYECLGGSSGFSVVRTFQRLDTGTYRGGESSLLADGKDVIRLLQISQILPRMDVYKDRRSMNSGRKLTDGNYLKI